MVALGTVLSIVSIGLPFGGTVTAGAMIPLVFISQTYGTKWGLFTCTVYGLLQMVLGLDNFGYAATAAAFIMILLFDYLAAYASVGFSGLTRKMKSRAAAGALGAVIGCACRFVCHFISGAFVWGQWAEVSALPEFLQSSRLAQPDVLIYSYSFFYNLTYMLPETILTVIGMLIISRIKTDSLISEN